MRRFGLFILLICWLAPGLALAGSINGLVTDEDGTPVMGAEVKIVGKARTVFSDENGRYELTDLPAGNYNLRFHTEGYDPATRQVGVKADEAVTLDVQLRFSVTFTQKEIVITDRAPVDETPQTSAHTFTREEIQSNAGALEDITKAIQQLPGIVSNTDFTSDMYVRGSENYENLIVLDRQLLANPYHFGIGMSIINTDLVKNFTFYAAGFPAQYPFATGSVLDITYRDGNRDHVDGIAEVSLLSASALASGPAGNQVTWTVNARRSYYDYMLRLLNWTDVPIPVFSDVMLRATWEPNDMHRLVALAIRSEDGARANITEDNPSIVDEGSAYYNQITQVYGLNYNFLPNSWFLSSTSASYQLLNASGNVTSGANSYFGRADAGGFYVNEDVQFSVPRNVFKLGGVYGRVDLDIGAKFPLSEYTPGARSSTENKYYNIEFSDSKPKQLYGFYVQHEAEIVPERLRTNIGARLDRFMATKNGWVFSPRASMSTNLTKSTVLKTGWGIYFLPPYNSFVSDEKLGNPNVRAEKSTHFVVGLEQGIGENIMVRLETYYKEFDDRIYQDMSGSAGSFLEQTDFVLQNEIPDILYTNSGYGNAQGLEAFFQKKLSGWWDGWVAYSISEVRYNDGMGRYGWYYPEQDQRHTLALVANVRALQDWVFSTSFRLTTGRPNTPVEGWEEEFPRTFLRFWQAESGPLNSDRFPLYDRLDVRAERTWHLHKRLDLAAFVEVYNVYNERNLYGYYYENEQGLDEPVRKPIYQLPFLPFGGIKVSLL